MVDQGARHLVLMGRRAASAKALSTIEAMERRGASVVVAAGDVSQEADLARVLAHVDASMPALRGVVHAAAVLDDGILLEQDVRRFRSVMPPKVRGTWNLNALTAGRPLDFFVMFSSVASFLASAGTGNYAAANAFLDAFADFRHSLGLPAICINWGGWARMGLAAGQEERLERLGDRGLRSFSEADALAALATVIRWKPTRVAAMRFDARAWCGAMEVTTPTSIFAQLLLEVGPGPAASADGDAEEPNLADCLRPVEAGAKRRAVLETYLQEQVARVLRLAPARIDAHKPFRTMGLDSLMALELRNRLEVRTGITIPATLVWNYPTVAQLATQLAIRVGVPLDGAEDRSADSSAVEATSPESDGDLAALLGEIEQLSDEDAGRLLAE